MPALKYWDGTTWQPATGPQGPVGSTGPTGPQGAAGNNAWIVTTQSAAYTAVNGNLVLANGTFTITLPAVALGAMVTIKNIGTGTITVVGASGTIDGTANAVLATQYQSITVVSDGTNWFDL